MSEGATKTGYPECEECRKLWHDYAAATTVHVNLTREGAGVRESEAAAEKNRTAAREAIDSHEESVHRVDDRIH